MLTTKNADGNERRIQSNPMPKGDSGFQRTCNYPNRSGARGVTRPTFASFVFLISLLFLCALTGCKPPGPRALWDGKQLLEHGDYTRAVERLKKATSLLNTNALAWNYLGLAYHQSGQPADAAEAYKKALALDQNLVEVHYDLGCLWLEQNRPDQAKSEFIAYTLRREKSPEGWVKLGEAQLRLRDLPGAEKSFNQARLLDAQNPEALNELGLLDIQRNRTSEAAAYFNGALNAKPDYAPAMLNLAIVSQDYLNDRQHALQWYRKYLDLKPQPANWQAADATARSLEQELNPAAPAPVVSRPAIHTNIVAQANPPAINTSRPTANPPPRTGPPKSEPTTAGNPKPQSQAQPQATSSPVEVVQLAPEPAVHAAQDGGSSDQTAAAGSREQSTVAESPKAADKRGFFSRMNPANLFKGNPKTNPEPATPAHPASTPVQVASANPEPQPAPAYSRYNYHSPRKPAAGNHGAAQKAFAEGSRQQQAGQLAEAAQAYERAIQDDPAYFDPYYNLGVVSVRSGKLSQALTSYETALAIQPESHDARFNFALALKQANYPIDAANELEKLIAKFPNDANAHYALANIYVQQLREPAKARPHYEKVLEVDPGYSQSYAIHDWLWANPP